MRNLRRLVAATLLGALVLTGCGQTTSPPEAKTSNQAYPMTVQAGNGSVTIPAAPKKIVSLAPSATEMLYAIGAGKQVVAVDDQSNYPSDAPKTKLSGFKPNAEAVIAHAPDLVVLSNDTDGIVKALQAVKIPVLLEPAATSLEDAYDQLTDLGKATGHASEAAKVVTDMKKTIADTVAATPKPTKPLSYYYELDNTFYSATSKTFVGSVLALFGLRNIADPADKQGGGYPQLSAEYIVGQNPDLVFLADTKCCGQNAAALAKRPAWAGMAALKKGNVVELDDDIASRWGPRVVELVKAAAAAITKAAKGS